MPRAVILTSHSDDYNAIRVHLTDLREDTLEQGTVYEIGKFSGNEHDWTIAIAEINPDNASSASETERAIRRYNPDVFFLVNAATGLKDVSLGDVVVANKICNYQVGKEEEGFLSRPDLANTSYRLQARAKAERRKSDWLERLPSGIVNINQKIFISPIVSGDKELSGQAVELLKIIHDRYNDAIAVETSGFGCVKAIEAYKTIDVLTVHGIAHLINNSEDTTLLEPRAFALRNASAFTFEILSKLKIDETEVTQRIDEISLQKISIDALVSDIGQKVKDSISLAPKTIANEHHRRFNHVQKLMDNGQLKEAIQYLEELKQELWAQADSSFRYQLLVNLGVASLGMGENSSAAPKFIEALHYNPEDDAALAYAGMGYTFQKEFGKAEACIEKALDINPANELAHSLRVRMSSKDESIESVLNKVPTAYQNNPNVLIAMGTVALDRELYEETEYYWRSALSTSTGSGLDAVKISLGAVLMRSIVPKYPLIASGQMLQADKDSLEEAISFFTGVLGSDYVNPNDLSHLTITALINRAIALRCLRQYSDAARDADIALAKTPKDPSLLKLRALLAYEMGDVEAAYTYAQQIVSSHQTPEASLLTASFLLELKRPTEAEAILDKFLGLNISEGLRQEARRMKLHISIKNDDCEKAEKIIQDMYHEYPDSLSTYVEAIRYQKAFGDELQIPKLVEQAKASLTHKSPILEKIELANLLSSLHYHQDAAKVYEQFVDKDCNNSLSQRLIQTYYLSGNYKEALDSCNRLLRKYGPLEMVSEMAAFIYGDIGDMASAREICENHLDIYPEDTAVKIRLATTYYEIGEHEKLDQILNSNLSTENLPIEPLKQLAQLYKSRKNIAKFLELLYEIRRRFYAIGEVHGYYQASYIQATQLCEPGVQSFEEVHDGCGVLLRNEFGREQWYIVEDRPDADFARHELNAKQPLYQELISKACGEEIAKSGKNLGQQTSRIIAITDKYFAAGKISFPILENQDLKSFRMFPVSIDENENSSDWVENFLSMLKGWQEQSEKMKSDYIAGKLPFGTLSAIQNRNPLEIWQNLVFDPEPFIHSWSNFKYEKFSEALITLKKGGFVIIDPISLMTLHHLKVADDVVQVLGQFGIAQSAISMFRSMIEKLKDFEKEGLQTIGVEKGQPKGYHLTAAQISQQKAFLEEIIEWSSENCRVLPCRKALEIDKDNRVQFEKCMGTAFADTALIAGENGRILYSDDQWLRWYVRADTATPGVWTQVVLEHCFLSQNVNEPLYQKSIFWLADHGYSYLGVTPNLLLEASRLADWKPEPPYTSLLKSFSRIDIDLSYVISIAAEFLYELYLEADLAEQQLIDLRDPLLLALLNALTKHRSILTTVPLIEQAVRQRFHLMPVEMKKILMTINFWELQQIIR
jgi:tetratricopeptide (TPR) repeat protein